MSRVKENLESIARLRVMCESMIKLEEKMVELCNEFVSSCDSIPDQRETRIAYAEADLDPHGIDYGVRYLRLRLPDDTPEGTRYEVKIKLMV